MYSVNMILKPILIQAIVVNEYIRVWISSPENIGPVYKTYMFVFWKGGGGGFQKKLRVFIFSQISVITDGPLVLLILVDGTDCFRVPLVSQILKLLH